MCGYSCSKNLLFGIYIEAPDVWKLPYTPNNSPSLSMVASFKRDDAVVALLGGPGYLFICAST